MDTETSHIKNLGITQARLPDTATLTPQQAQAVEHHQQTGAHVGEHRHPVCRR
jgi:hypothetical protein